MKYNSFLNFMSAGKRLGRYREEILRRFIKLYDEFY